MDGPAPLLNAYLWVGSDGVTLIDTGWPSSADTIEAALVVFDAVRMRLVEIGGIVERR